jgi:RNA polymerase sigma factor (TIGR02999 family)
VPAADVTQLLQSWSRGDSAALDELTPLVYQELHDRARRYLRRERAEHTLQPTALIHEAYMRLAADGPGACENRAHFFAIASRVMRRVLVDHARRKKSGKRGGGLPELSLEEAITPAGARGSDLLALDEALAKLEAFDARKCRVIEMRYFGGCTVEEIAEALGVATITVVRDSRVAEAWLRSSMLGEQQ